MRYVIGVCILTGMIVWDAVYYDGYYLELIVRQLRLFMSLFGLDV